MAKFLLVLIILVYYTSDIALSYPRLKEVFDWRIVGGEPAPPGKFPYQVSLKKNNVYLCGGSILSGRWIVTAANCVDGTNTSDLSVLVGTITLHAGGYEEQISRKIVHPKWNWVAEGDIALLYTTSPLRLGGNVLPIAIEKEHIEEGVDAILSGWGTTTNPGPIPNYLHYINLKTVSNKDCQSQHAPIEIFESQICTFTRKGEGACYGDSGDPLAANDKLIGILSWGKPCGEGYPDVYTRVSYYADWIAENVN